MTARLPQQLTTILDTWAENEQLTRGEAIRWIIGEYFKK